MPTVQAPRSMTTWATVTRARIEKFFRNWGPPYLGREASDQELRQERYDRLWDRAVGNAYTDKRRWGAYRRTHGLYRNTRSMVDYAHVAAQFWASRCWAGAIAEDGLTLPDGQTNAVPLAKDTDPEVAAAAAQVLFWTNFQTLLSQIPFYAAALGEVLVEIVDDVERGKILWDVVWPGYVKEVDLDEAGHIQSYTLSYEVIDPDTGRPFIYSKVVDKEAIRTFRDGRPFGFDGADAVTDNPYGFVSARWFRHWPMLGTRGEPAIYAAEAEIDEINSMISHLADKVHVNLASPVVVAGNIMPNSLARVAPAKRVTTEDLADPGSVAEQWEVLEAPQGTDIKTVQVHTAETIALVKEIQRSVEAKLPEVEYQNKMREMTQVTGPVSSRLSTDVDARFKAITAGHDRNLAALLEMSIAIGGWRANNGDWDGTQRRGGLTAAQERFLPFDLESHPAGELSIVIMPRDLIPETAVDRMNLLVAKKNALQLLQTPTGAETLMAEAGYPEDLIRKVAAEAEQQRQEQQQLQRDQMRATMAPPPGNPRRGSVGRNQPGVPNRNGRPPTGQGVR